MQKVSEVSGTL